MKGRAGRVLLVLAVAVALVGCRDDEPSTTSTTSTTTPASTDTIAPDDPALSALLLAPGDLPDGFTADENVADTVTVFCAGQDATAGLNAEGRAIVGFTRTPPGASVIELVFRFEGDGAAQLVTQAEEILASCSDVPDATGLAFTYAPLSEPVAATLAEADTATGRFGTSVGAGNFTLEVAVVQLGDLGALVAVLGLDEPRADLDELAVATFSAAIKKLTG